jgi:hypothetical protein
MVQKKKDKLVFVNLHLVGSAFRLRLWWWYYFRFFPPIREAWVAEQST